MEAFKNVFNKEFVNNFANKIQKFDKSFKKDAYIIHVMENLENQELKERMRAISSSINSFSSKNYKDMIEVLINVKKNMNYDESISLSSMVLPDYVEVYGLPYLSVSLIALEEFTKNSSSELAIRHFIKRYENETMNQMLIWAKSPDEHIRRLASEGSRPRLPWAIALNAFKKNPSQVFEIIELLKNDEFLYVRKSVANNLNDISKDNKDLVIAFIKNNINVNKNLDWILKHGARTLLKDGNKEVLEYFGFKEIKDLKIENFNVPLTVKEGKKLDFSFEIKSLDILKNIRIEFELVFVRLNNKTSKKVFMISQSYCKNKIKTVNKSYNFKKITTRKYYKGLHEISIIVNGVKKVSKNFILE